MATEARQRMIETTALLIRERGIEATAFSDVIKASGAPRGSIYHYFPGGKSQLVEEATKWAGESIAGGLARALEESDPITGLRRFEAAWRSVLLESEFLAGCPVVAASVEGDANPGARDAAAGAFAEWERQLSRSLRDRGLEGDRADSLATLIVAAMEGAIVLSALGGPPTPSTALQANSNGRSPRRSRPDQAGGFSANCGTSSPISCHGALNATWR